MHGTPVMKMNQRWLLGLPSVIIALLLLVCPAAGVAESAKRPFVQLATLSIQDVAYVHLLDGDLYATQFAAFSNGTVSVVPHIGQQLIANPLHMEIQRAVAPSAGLLWPNEMTTFPSDWQSKDETGFILGDGFLVPGQMDGSITAVYVHISPNGSHSFTTRKLTHSDSRAVPAAHHSTQQHQQSSPAPAWFYHKGFFVDVDGDGLQDIITARATMPQAQAGAGRGELLWLRAPRWDVHILGAGPDMNFDVLYLNGTSAPVVVYAAEFFGEQLSAFQIGLGGEVTKQAVLDRTVGQVYAVQMSDLYNRGSAGELVVTNYVGLGKGSLFVYELDPGNPLKVLQRHTIYDQFQNVQLEFGAGAPGFVYPHWPRPRQFVPVGQLANLMVAGDGSEQAYLFTAVPGSPQKYHYQLTWQKNFAATVGGMAIGATVVSAASPFAGFNQVFLTVYEKGEVHVYSYSGSNVAS